MKKQENLAPPEPVETLATIGPVARSSVVDAVAERLQGEILAGRIPAGARLPSERELSLALGVNRLTLRAALARLEAQGLVSTRHGAGTIVSSWRERAGLDALATLIGSLKQGEPAYKELVLSLLELRKVLAAEAVALAAERHTDEDIEALTRIAEQQKTRVHDPVAFARGEIAFERALIRASRNVGLELILNTFARFPEEQPHLVAELYDRCEDSAFFAEMVVTLVRAGDGETARKAIRDGLDAMDREWIKRHDYPNPHASRASKGADKAKRRTK